ncbi:prepilin peptidase-dependent pilin, partial [Enterobacteriaceae bacterium 8376wG6]|nr:prepilin peptidase-dependent pilin [Enterobacteriaceae bacterium 8376wG6]
LTGSQTLQGLAVALTPKSNADGLTRWTRLCSSENATLVEVCQEVFRFDNAAE